MDSLVLAWILTGLAAGGLLAAASVWAWLSRDFKSRESSLRAELESTRAEVSQLQALRVELEQARAKSEASLEIQNSRLTELKDELAGSRSELAQAAGRERALQGEIQSLRSEESSLKARIQDREDRLAELKQQFEEQKRALSTEFKLLADQVLDVKTKALQESSKEGLGVMLDPFKQSMEAFKKEVTDIHYKETQQRSELKKELEQLKELNRQITQEAHELSTALKGQKKLQGNWGELVLDNVLERSGLIPGKDYEREVSFNLEEGGRSRPDVVVHLPQGKNLIVDAKVSLNAYTRYVNAEDELERAQALRDHVKAMSDRITELADRKYHEIPELRSPEVVFMFVPVESAFVEALKADESLFQKAIAQNVLVATPTTLLTSLNIVRQLWRFEEQNKHTAALAAKADGVYKKLASFLKSFQEVKKGIDKAAEAYGKAENQLVSGRGNLVKQVNDFKDLAPAIAAEMPEHFLEKAELEIDLEADGSAEVSDAQTRLPMETVAGAISEPGLVRDTDAGSDTDSEAAA